MTRRRLVGLLLGTGALALLTRAAAAQLFSAPDWYTIANAAAGNKIDEVRTFLVKGQDPDTVDSRGRTALSYAAQLGNAEMTRLLLDSRASPDARDKLGNTAAHWAADTGHVDIMKLLIGAHASLDVPNRQGITPLMMASGHGNVAIVKLLLREGADPRKQDYSGRDALGWAADQPAVLRELQQAKRS